MYVTVESVSVNISQLQDRETSLHVICFSAYCLQKKKKIENFLFQLCLASVTVFPGEQKYPLPPLSLDSFPG